MTVYYTDDGVPHGDNYTLTVEATIKVHVTFNDLSEDQFNDIDNNEVFEAVSDELGTRDFDLVGWDVWESDVE